MTRPDSKPGRGLRVLVLTTAHLFPSRSRPHAGVFFAGMLRRLQRLAERVVVVTPTAWVPSWLGRLPGLGRYGPVVRHEVWQGLEVYRPPYLSVRANRHLGFQARSFALAAGPLCEALHRRHGFDVVLGNGFGLQAHAAEHVGRRIGRRAVCWAIGSDVHTMPRLSAENGRLLRQNVRRADLVLATSRDLRRTLLEACPGARHVHTFYRGIDLADLRTLRDRAAARAAVGLRPEGTTLLMVGHAGKAKGTDEFAEVFRRLAPRHPDLSAVWVGDGPESGALRRRAAEAGLGDRLVLSGHVARAAVLDYMRAADVMLFPSHAEGLPNVVMEAMAAELPVVAAAVGGTAEIVRDGRTGVLVPPRDASAMAAGVERLLADREAAARLAGAGRAFILRHFDVDRNTPVLVGILEHIASGGAPDAPLAPCADVAPGGRPAPDAAP